MRTIKKSPDFDLIKIGFTQVLEGLKINLKDENYKETPSRMAQTYIDLCSGLYSFSEDDLEHEFEKVFSTKYSGIIVQKPIKVYSLCSHHLLPIFYTVYFGYMPTDKTLGFSKSIKLIEHLASKPLSQEDFTQEIVDYFDKALKPKGCIVFVKGVHLCMKIRGLRCDSGNVTISHKGNFEKDDDLRSQFMKLVLQDDKD